MIDVSSSATRPRRSFIAERASSHDGDDSLHAASAKAIFVSNRTYERAASLAEMLGGRAIHFDQWEREYGVSRPNMMKSLLPLGYKAVAASNGGRHDFVSRTVVWAIGDLERQMKEAAKALGFERAAALRDEVAELRKFVNPGDIATPRGRDTKAGG